MKHRADIDGLRALAVVPVVLFHLGVTAFSGGYVGVDVFFVISGYLITGLIVEDIKQGRFTISNFYERRIRRIFPALFAMLLCSFIAGLVLFLPQDIKSLNASLAATSLFASNIYLWRGSGYFARAAEMQPLLHTWSLAVEEQFYIFFPLFLVLVGRWGRQMRSLTWLVLLGSFVLSVYAVHRYSSAAFYLLPTRAWELLIGSVIALNAAPRLSTEWQKRWLNEAFALLGVLFILLAVFTYQRSTRFPGESALLPCVGAGLIIYAGLDGVQTSVSRILCWRPVVFIGLISYSLYLWHWPLIVFAKYYNIVALSRAQTIAVLVASVVMAVLSWRFIERPFRRPSRAPGHAPSHALATKQTPAIRRWNSWPWISNRVVAHGLVVVSVSILICSISYTVYSNEGAVLRFYGERIYRYDHESLQIQSPETCLQNVVAAARKDCLLGDVQAAPSVALWGDSYADALIDSLSTALKTERLSAERFVMHSCPSILNTLWNNPSSGPRFAEMCKQFNEATFRTLVNSSDIKTVILLNNYLWYLETQPVPLLIPTRPFSDENVRRQMILDELSTTIASLTASGKQVIVIGAYPTGISAGAIARSLNFTGEIPSAVTTARVDYDNKVGIVNSRLAKLTGDKVVFIDPSALFCPDHDGAECSVVQHDVPLLSDGSHLSAAGATELTRLISATIARRS